MNSSPCLSFEPEAGEFEFATAKVGRVENRADAEDEAEGKRCAGEDDKGLVLWVWGCSCC